MAGQLSSANGNVDMKGGAKVRLPAIFPWPLGKLVVPQKGCGLGDPMSTSLKNMSQPWREQIGVFVFENDGSENLILSAGSTVNYFANGSGGAVPSNVNLGWVANIGDTNLLQDSIVVPQNFLFAGVAIGFSIGRPFGLEPASGGVYPKKKHYAAWSDSYGARARDLLWSNLGFSVAYKDTACNFELGAPELYPPHAGQYGGDTVRAGGGFGLLGMLPVDRGPIYIGSKEDSTSATITGTSTLEDLRLDLDADAPVPTDYSLGVPVRTIVYGDYGPWCGPCAPTDEEINDKVQAGIQAMLPGIIQQVQRQLQANNK
jgi:hypothetical protein